MHIKTILIYLNVFLFICVVSMFFVALRSRKFSQIGRVHCDEDPECGPRHECNDGGCRLKYE